MTGNRSLKRSERLSGHATFDAIKRDGSVFRGRQLLVTVCHNSLPYNRIGISISTRVAAKSVIRHRAKRLITEAYREHKEEFKAGLDLIFRIKSNSIKKTTKLRDVEKDLISMFSRAGLLK